VEPVRPETSRNGSYVCVRMCACVCEYGRRMPWRSRCLCIGYCAVPTLVSPFVFQVTRHLRNPSTSTSTCPACHLVIPSLFRLHSIASASLVPNRSLLNKYLDIASR